jgi:hypothetical protein
VAETRNFLFSFFKICLDNIQTWIKKSSHDTHPLSLAAPSWKICLVSKILLSLSYFSTLTPDDTARRNAVVQKLDAFTTLLYSPEKMFQIVQRRIIKIFKNLKIKKNGWLRNRRSILFISKSSLDYERVVVSGVQYFTSSRSRRCLLRPDISFPPQQMNFV